jgi:hypothetical protein
MRDDGAKRRILDRSRNLIEFVLRGDRYISGAVDPIPLRERCALNMVSHGLCRLVDRVRAKIGYRLPNRIPRIVGRGFWTVSSLLGPDLIQVLRSFRDERRIINVSLTERNHPSNARSSGLKLDCGRSPNHWQ